MFKRIAAVAATAVLVTVGLAGGASADHVSDGAWNSTSYRDVCRGAQQGDPDGGFILTRFHGQEVRADRAEFETWRATTRTIAEKDVNGSWVPLYWSIWRVSSINDARYNPGDGMYHAPLTFNPRVFDHPRHPRFVAPIDTNGVWRLQVETVVYQQDGVPVAYLLNTTAECDFAGKK
jgi:hypothetical protein